MYGKDSGEGSKCVYSNHTASYESLLNKARLPSLEVGRQMNIAIQTFKILNDLSPTYLLELIEKRCRTRNLRNSENILKIPLMKRVRHGANSFCFLAPKIWNSLPEALRITRDLTGHSISDIILIIQCHLQGQRGQFQGEVRENTFLTNKARNMCNTSYYGISTDKSNYSII